MRKAPRALWYSLSFVSACQGSVLRFQPYDFILQRTPKNRRGKCTIPQSATEGVLNAAESEPRFRSELRASHAPSELSPEQSKRSPGARWTVTNPVGERRRSEEHTSELQSLAYLVCRLLLEKKKEETTRTLIRELD